MTYTDPIFLEIADSLEIPENLAISLYTTIKNKKSTQYHLWQLAKHLNVDLKVASQKVAQLKKSYQTTKFEESKSHAEVDLVSEARQFLDYAIGKSLKSQGPQKLITSKQEIDVISDLHFPFVDQNAINKLFESPGDELWIVGDILDFYSVSRHRKELEHVLVREELAQARAFLELCSKTYTKVKIISGNHDGRMMKQVLDLLPQLLPLIVKPLVTLTHGLDNVEVLETEIEGTSPQSAYQSNHTMDYLAQVDNALLCHFENFCGKEAPEKVYDFLKDFSHLIPVQNYNIILQGHTHRLGMNFTPKGELLVSTGCMCKPMPYIFSGHGKYPAPTTGFIKLTRVNGYINPSDTRIIKI